MSPVLSITPTRAKMPPNGAEETESKTPLMKRLFTSSVSSSKKKNEPSSSSVSSKNDPVELEEEEMSTSATIGSGGPKMDRYGFFVDESKQSSTVTGKINMVQLRSDAQKWESRLGKVSSSSDGNKSNGQRGSVDATYSTNPSKMKYYTRRGLPDGLRKKAWTSLTGVDLIIKAHSGKYDELVNSASARYENLQTDNGNSNNKSSDSSNFDMGTIKAAMETIDRDIHRTYPKHFLFCGGNKDDEKDDSTLDDIDESSVTKNQPEAFGMGHGQSSLRRVLRAYSMYDTDVGYCQGMNFIAAMFLTFLTEEESFWLLVVVMNEEPYKLREMFGEDMAGTHEVLYIAEKLIEQFLPKFANTLQDEMINMSMIVTPWLMTVYASTFPFELVVRVWDSFLVEGWKVVYRVMLSLLGHASKDLTDKTFEDILNYFRDFPSTVNGQTIMAGSLRIPLKSKHIQNHVLQWSRQVKRKGSNSSGDAKQVKDEGMSRAGRLMPKRNSSASAGLNDSLLNACAIGDDAKINDDDDDDAKINDDDAKISDSSGDDEFQKFLKG